MAKVSLRVYNHEIEGMIEAGQLDEAIAHCQHILRTFPMYVETYRLLGKCFLEARRYTDAADIFQRALMAVPDDFVSHVGMSIIHDDEGKLDDAIWHMERAFEGQPSNPAIQGELRRLYGRRDGVEPSKIRLSRDALANMYAQGELFNQAIAEIRAVLAEDNNRPDLQVMLARAYYRSGQKVEAAEMAANLLKKYSYCLDALRILVDVLPGSARTENTQVYRQRLGMLDPYSSFITGSAFTTDQVPDAAVILERLEYKGSGSSAFPQPNWASSLGIKLEEEKHSEPVPDWMKPGESEGITPSVTPASSTSEVSNKSIPDWMRSAEWQESSGNAEAEQLKPVIEEPARQIAQADIPDWLKAMAPKEITDANAGSGSTDENLPFKSGGDTPDWLKDIVQQEKEEEHTDSEAAPVKLSFPEGQAPLDAIAESGPAGEETIPAQSQPAVSPETDRAFPDWLKEIGETTTGEVVAARASQALEKPVSEEMAALTSPVPADVPIPAEAESPISASQVAEDALIHGTGETKPLEIEDESLAWLKNLDARQGVGDEESLSKREYTSDEMPDWLRSNDEHPASPDKPEPAMTPSESIPLEEILPLEGEAAVSAALPLEELPGSMPPPEESTRPVKIEDDTMAWLESLAAKGANEEVSSVKPEDRLEGMPDWLRSPDVQPASQAETEPSIPSRGSMPQESIQPLIGEEAIPETQEAEGLPSQNLATVESTKPVGVEDEEKGFLEGVSNQQAAKIEEPVAEPEDRLEGMPDWLRSPDKQPAFPVSPELIPAPNESIPLELIPPLAGEAEAIEPLPTGQPETPALPTEKTSQPVNIEDQTMAWLEGLAARQGAKEEELLTKPEDRLEEMPDWFHSGDNIPPVPAAPEKSPVAGETLPLEAQLPDAGGFAALESAPAQEAPLQTPVSEGPSQPPAEETLSTTTEGQATTQETGLDESLTNLRDQSGRPPEWVQDSGQEIPAQAEESAPVPAEEDESITSWLSKLDIQEALGKDQPSSGEEPAAVTPSNELPDWLKGMDKAATPVETPKPAENLPDWLREPVLPVDQGTVAPPIPEQPAEPEMPAWVDEEIPVSDQPAPTTPGEWVPVEEKLASVPETQPVPEPVSKPVQPPVQLWIPKGTGMLARIPSQDKDSESLVMAQALLNVDRLNEAMQAYGVLIKKNRLLEEVIHDLYEAIYRFPVDIVVWQTLGDAFMRSNRLQDALDAYTKAEELLR